MRWQGIRDLLAGIKPQTTAHVPREKPAKTLVQQIWESPALYNRALRRAARLYSHIWRWDLNATAETRRVFVPRYIRRHYQGSGPTGTRRQRRHWARIERITRSKGLA